MLNPHQPDHNAVLQRMAAGDDEQQAREYVAQTLVQQAQRPVSRDRDAELYDRAMQLREGR